jgi:signal transduction histidine kinase
MTLPQLLRLGLFLGASLLAASVFLLANWAIDRLTREVASTSRVLAQFCAEASYPVVRNPQIEDVFKRLVASLDFPMVITDRAGVPRAWRGIEVHPDSVRSESIDSLVAGQAISPVIAGRIERVRLTVARLDHENRPIPFIERRQVPPPMLQGRPLPTTDWFLPDTLGAVHFGNPHVLEVLRWTPYVSLAGTLLLLGLGFLGLAAIRAAEKRTIWVGMAKETAHQLGTPLSSLMGWSELLRGHLPDPPAGEVRMPAEELSETVTEIERDVERLRKVASRFSNVGSQPRLVVGDPVAVVREVAGYMRRRLPRGGGEVELVERYEPVPQVRLNADLLEWAVENLITNALSALDKQPARIEVSVAPAAGGRWVEIAVTDNGRGMNAREQRRAFEPGYTTKRRGWGLGLPLARRVIQDSHGGRIWVRASAPGQGTTVAIRLPAVS